jgi:uncharacterized protein YndB with AHSA1/START domain
MTAIPFNQPPAARTGMLIRRPVAEVFAAFVDPQVTTRFWFTRSSGRLEAGKQVTWDGLRMAVLGPKWEMYGASTSVSVQAIEPDRRILIEWDGYSGRTRVEWRFAARPDGSTFVGITETGWTGDPDELVQYVSDSTEGFTWTLAGLKALLEHGIELNLVEDRFPDGPGHPYPDQ